MAEPQWVFDPSRNAYYYYDHASQTFVYQNGSRVRMQTEPNPSNPSIPRSQLSDSVEQSIGHSYGGGHLPSSSPSAENQSNAATPPYYHAQPQPTSSVDSSGYHYPQRSTRYPARPYAETAGPHGTTAKDVQQVPNMNMVLWHWKHPQELIADPEITQTDEEHQRHRAGDRNRYGRNQDRFRNAGRYDENDHDDGEDKESKDDK